MARLAGAMALATGCVVAACGHELIAPRLQPTLDQARPSAEVCWAEGKKQLPELQGTVSAVLWIDADGRVSAVDPGLSELGSSQARPCLMDRLRALHFDRLSSPAVALVDVTLKAPAVRMEVREALAQSDVEKDPCRLVGGSLGTGGCASPPRPVDVTFDCPAPSELKSGMRVQVVVSVNVDASGHPLYVSVVEGTGAFAEAARACARRMQFLPARDTEGHAIPGKIASLDIMFVR